MYTQFMKNENSYNTDHYSNWFQIHSIVNEEFMSGKRRIIYQSVLYSAQHVQTNFYFLQELFNSFKHNKHQNVFEHLYLLKSCYH